jgi:ubiquinone biosynthesis protein
MTDVTGTLLKHRRRLNEITTALARHGLATWAARGGGIAGLAPIDTLVHHVVSEEDLNASEGERLRRALAKLGTTAVKSGQMLSLRPDLVGKDVADELSLLQADVPADATGVAVRTVEAQLGQPVAELYRSFEREPFASGSVAHVHRATLSDGTPVAVKVVHDGAHVKVREDLELLEP